MKTSAITLLCLLWSSAAISGVPNGDGAPVEPGVPNGDGALESGVPNGDGASVAEAETTDEGVAITLDETAIVARRTWQTVFEVGRSVDVMEREELNRKAATSLPDALRGSAGVHSQKTNSTGGAPIIRGMVGVDNLILVDGVRFNNSTFRTGPNQYLNLIEPWSLEQLEIIRGPGSVWFGSDALGGVINAVTLEPRMLADERWWGASARGVFRSASLTVSGAGQVDVDGGPVRGYAGGHYLYSGDLRAGGGDIQDLSGFARFGARMRSYQELGGGWSMAEAVFWNNLADAGRTDSLGQGRVRVYDNSDLMSYVRLERSGSGWAKSIKLNVSYHRTSERMLDVRCVTDDDGLAVDREMCLTMKGNTISKKDEYLDVVDTLGSFGSWNAELWDDRIHLSSGFDLYYDLVSSTGRTSDGSSSWLWNDKERGQFSDGSTFLSAGLFVAGDVDVLRLAAHRLNLEGGLRYSAFSATASNVPGIGRVAYDYMGVVGYANIKYFVDNNLNLYADFSQGFRAPNLQESTALGPTGKSFDAPNDDLEPVKTNSIEVGAKIRIDVFRVSVSGFVTWMDGLFARVELSQAEWMALGLAPEDVGVLPVYRRENAASAFFKGVEAVATIGPVYGLTGWANVSWTRGDVEDLAGVTAPASRVAPLMGSLGVRWEDPVLGLSAEVYGHWSLRQDRLAPEDLKDLRICEDPDRPGALLVGCDGTPGWWTVNVRAAYAPLEYVFITLELENILDQNYKYHGSGIFEPGFQVTTSMTFTY